MMPSDGEIGALTIAAAVEDERWEAAVADVLAQVERAAVELGRAEHAAGTMSLLLADDAELRALNAAYRNQDKPTNVLAFPAPAAPSAGGPRHWGDIAIAFGVAAEEAAAAAKPLRDHLLHLVVHGALHLLGYDHDEDAAAEAMEARERIVLAALGVADPYLERQDADLP